MRSKLYLVVVFIFVFGFSSQTVNAASVYELVSSSRVITRVIPGMTVEDIIRKIYPNEVKLWAEIKAKLIEINPYSFHSQSDQLVPGSRLKLIEIRRFEQQEISKKKKVGYIASQQGQATVTDLNGNTQTLQINSEVYEGDRISTGQNSNLFIAMDDGAEIYLKEDSVVKISEYIITPGFDRNSSSILDLIRGGLRKITGLIGASALSNYQLQTGLATIGIRGTEYVIKLCKLDDCSQAVSRNDPDAKLHAVVLEGIITLTTEDDFQILMARGDYGTATQVEMKVLDEDVEIAAGLLNAEEADRFGHTVMQQVEEEEPSDNTWKWIIGIALIAVGL
ncbi:MAG: FecR domain-containing protein [Proteobacteria bacterium]|nr:FecR domain-containing protein [Pseudomonadota bacterium]